tara:strand:- start:8065 stop:8850 length:786 start_codon:yes stop_codon:yes gene_type:complete
MLPKTVTDKIIPNEFTLVQLSDSHLFADINGQHHQANVYQNLKRVLLSIKQQPSIDAIVFTGDLTQDHTEASYQLFANAFDDLEINIPVYFVAGNHDEPALLKQYLSKAPFCQSSVIENDYWQVLLLESKSETPAGVITAEECNKASSIINPAKSQLLLTHHHAVDAGFFIDRHGLLNKEEFYLWLTKFSSIKALGCGHIHQALILPITLVGRTINLYTCPATSIQFDINSATVASNGQGPGYQVFTLASTGEISRKVIFV